MNTDVLTNFTYWYGIRRLEGGEDRFERICEAEFNKFSEEKRFELEKYCAGIDHHPDADRELRDMFRAIKLRFNRGDYE